MASLPQRFAIVELSQQFDNCRAKLQAEKIALEAMIPSLATKNFDSVAGPESKLLEAYNGFGRVLEKLDFLVNALPSL